MRRRDTGWRSQRSRPTPPPPAAAPTPPGGSTPAATPAATTPPPAAAQPAAAPPRATPAYGRGGLADPSRRLAGTRGGAVRGGGAAAAASAGAAGTPRLGTAPVAPAAAAGTSSDGGATFDRPFFGSPLKGVDWTISLAGFLVYIYIITTYVVPIGDVAMVVALVGLFFIIDRLGIPPMLGLMAACVVWSAVSYTTTDYPWIVGNSVKDFGKLWLIALVGVAVLNTRANVRLFMILFLGGFALYPTRGAIINYLTGNTLAGRAIWNHIYNNPNDLAALALLQLSMAFGLYRLERLKWVRWCAMLGIAMMPLIILMTQSRGAFIALAVFIVLLLAAQRRRARAFVIITVVGAVVAMVAPRGVWERVGGLKNATSTQTLDKADQEGSARQRYEIWRVAGRIIQDHPITGVGLGAYGLVHADYAATRPGLARTARGKRDTHSTYLNVAAELGYPGLLLFLALVGWTLFAAESARRRARPLMPESAMMLYSLEVGLIAFLIAGIWGSFVHLSFLYIHLALVTAVTRLTLQDVAAIERGAVPASAAPAANVSTRGRGAPAAAAAARAHRGRLGPGSGGGSGAQPAY